MAGSGEVPKKLKDYPDYKVLVLIFGLAVAFQIFNSRDAMYVEFNIFMALQTSGLIACFVTSFLVARRYWGSEIFGRAYIALTIGFVLYFLGDIIKYYYDYVLRVQSYPSIADVFYLAVYPFVIYHLVKNIIYFKGKGNITALTKSWLVAIPIAIVLIYSYFTYATIGEFNFDYYYGLIFVSLVSVSLSHAVLGAQVFRHSVLAATWSLLAIGIFLNTLGHVWFHYLQIFNQYNHTHPVGTLWITGYMLITYALYKHLKTI